jgi:hypothetical protein
MKRRICSENQRPALRSSAAATAKGIWATGPKALTPLIDPFDSDDGRRIQPSAPLSFLQLGTGGGIRAGQQGSKKMESRGSNLNSAELRQVVYSVQLS